MQRKLILSMSASVIENAKIYAKNNETSLSKLIEEYLKSIIDKNAKNVGVTPLVQSLSGVITLPEKFKRKENHTDFLLEKYK